VTKGRGALLSGYRLKTMIRGGGGRSPARASAGAVRGRPQRSRGAGCRGRCGRSAPRWSGSPSRLVGDHHDVPPIEQERESVCSGKNGPSRARLALRNRLPTDGVCPAPGDGEGHNRRCVRLTRPAPLDELIERCLDYRTQRSGAAVTARDLDGQIGSPRRTPQESPPPRRGTLEDSRQRSTSKNAQGVCGTSCGGRRSGAREMRPR